MPLPSPEPRAVAVAGQALHRPQRAHAPVLLEAAPFVDDHLAGRLVQAGQQAAQHHGVGAGGQGLDDVARVPDAAVGDDRGAPAVGLFGAVLDGGDLRHAHAGHDARRADRAGAHAHLDHVGAGGDQVAGALGGDDVAGDQGQVRVAPT